MSKVTEAAIQELKLKEAFQLHCAGLNKQRKTSLYVNSTFIHSPHLSQGAYLTIHYPTHPIITSPAPLVKTAARSPATYRRLSCARHTARHLTCRIPFYRNRSLGPWKEPLLSSLTLPKQAEEFLGTAACQT